MLDPIVRDYLFHDFRRKSTGDKLILGAIAVVVVILGFLGWRGVLHGQSPFTVWVWVPYSILGSLIAYFILAFLDRERRVRSYHLLTIATVMLIAGPAAGFFNRLFPAPIDHMTVGVFEEGMKILPVLLLAIYVPNLIRTRKDGIVYGALAGMGFNIIEIGLYISKQLHQNTLLESIYIHSTRFGFGGFGGHLVWSAFVGLGIGLAAESTKHGWAKWSRAVYFYLISAVSHSIYDLGVNGVFMIAVGSVVGMIRGVDLTTATDLSNPIASPGPLNDGARYGVYGWTIVLIIIMIVQVRRAFRLENTIQIDELSAEDSAVITAAELQQLKDERLFFKRKYTAFPKKVGEKMVLYQNLLAMQKHTAAQLERSLDPIEPVAALRGAI
ncbi:MAG: PrsW family intramembrane metalloprotease, partial [Caldilineaceae bacterium]|nr:PrsW family intramembrane metalloprotease [Caldilineaceae bacterium]